MKRPKDRLDKLLKGYYRSSDQSVGPMLYSKKYISINDNHMDMSVCGNIDSCDKAPKKVCPSSESLSAYADNLLSENEREAIEIHIKQCKKCLEMIKSAQDAIGRYIKGDLEGTPEDISNNTRSKLYSSDRKTKPPKDKKSL